MLVDRKNPGRHGKVCDRCSCPLTLLKVDKWKWESRRICARCSTPKGTSSTLLEAALSEARPGRKRGMKAALKERDKDGSETA